MDTNKARQEALKEFEEEKFEKAKRKFKQKLQELDNAEKVVANIKRELEDLELELSQDNK